MRGSCSNKLRDLFCWQAVPVQLGCRLATVTVGAEYIAFGDFSKDGGFIALADQVGYRGDFSSRISVVEFQNHRVVFTTDQAWMVKQIVPNQLSYFGASASVTGRRGR